MTREEAIDKLEYQIRLLYDIIPHVSRDDGEYLEAAAKTMSDVFTLLEAQNVPKVLSFQEMEILTQNTNIFEWLWLEEKQQVIWNLHCVRAFVYSKHPDTKGFYIMANAYHDIAKFEGDEYGKTWRCWTSRPTDVQRKETAWPGA